MICAALQINLGVNIVCFSDFFARLPRIEVAMEPNILILSVYLVYKIFKPK